MHEAFLSVSEKWIVEDNNVLQLEAEKLCFLIHIQDIVALYSPTKPFPNLKFKNFEYPNRSKM